MSSDNVKRKSRPDLLVDLQVLRKQLANPNLPMSSERRKAKADDMLLSLSVMTKDMNIDPEAGLFEYAIMFELACMRILFNYEVHAA